MPASDESTIPAHARQVLIAVNPRAGAWSVRPQVEQLSRALRERRFEVDVNESWPELAEQATELQAAGRLRAVVAAGGDGTAALGANYLTPNMPLALLPLGTENLLARHLQIPRRPEVVADIIAAGRTTQLDAAAANGRIFLLMAGCGLDAEVVRRLHTRRDGHISHWSYVQPILGALRSYPYPPLRIHCRDVDGEATSEPIEACWALVANLPRYALGLNFAPEASAYDGLLDVCAFRQGGWLPGMRYLTGVTLGYHRRMNDCVMVRAPHVRIESQAPAPIQLDGDPAGETPCDFRCLPRRLRLLAPSRWITEQVREGELAAAWQPSVA